MKTKDENKKNNIQRDVLIRVLQKQSHNEYFCSLTQIGACLGVSANTVKKYLKDLTPIIGKKYLIEDVVSILIGEEAVNG